jgi:hypothetical protein
MKILKKLAQKILKYKTTSVSTVFVDKIIIQEWLLFGTFKIGRTFKKG